MVLDHFDEVGVRQQGLRRDAAPVEADAAELVLLDAEHSFAELRRRIAPAYPAGPPPITTMSKSYAMVPLEKTEPPATSVSMRRGSRASVDDRPWGNRYQSNIEAGSSSRPLRVRRNSAARAPSTARWSAVRVTVITCADGEALFSTTGRSSAAPTARIADFGQVEDRVELLDAVHPEVADRERAARSSARA